MSQKGCPLLQANNLILRLKYQMAFLHKDSNIIHAYKDWENITTPADGFGFGLVSAYISPINVDINSVNVD